MTIRNLLAITAAALATIRGGVAADSQLAPYFQRMLEASTEPSRYDAVASTAPDLSKVVPSDEIPTILSAVNSGNSILMRAAVRDATTILTIHKADGENPNLRKPRPPLPEVMRQFQALVPALLAHFGDLTAPTSVIAAGQTDYTEIGWKTCVVQLVDLIGADPSQDMLQWMLKVVRWPKGRTEDSLEKIEEIHATYGLKKLTDFELGSQRQTIIGVARATALSVIPALAHLSPMPPEVLAGLLVKIDDRDEPQAAALAISCLSRNRAVGSKLSGEFVTKAFDEEAPVEVRIAAIYAIGTLKLTAVLPELAPLLRHPNGKISGAAIDIGVAR
jgi:hypothetical protein